jgi:hypothetical protein
MSKNYLLFKIYLKNHHHNNKINDYQYSTVCGIRNESTGLWVFSFGWGYIEALTTIYFDSLDN